VVVVARLVVSQIAVWLPSVRLEIVMILRIRIAAWP